EPLRFRGGAGPSNGQRERDGERNTTKQDDPARVSVAVLVHRCTVSLVVPTENFKVEGVKPDLSNRILLRPSLYRDDEIFCEDHCRSQGPTLQLKPLLAEKRIEIRQELSDILAKRWCHCEWFVVCLTPELACVRIK